jgi:hypothetical protein
MSKLLELQEKRANIWEQAKAFLDEKQAAGDTLSTEDAAPPMTRWKPMSWRWARKSTD